MTQAKTRTSDESVTACLGTLVGINKGAEMAIKDRAVLPYWLACRLAAMPSLVCNSRSPLSTTITVLPS